MENWVAEARKALPFSIGFDITMESTEELQQNELTALKSIYAEDFIEIPPPKAWKVSQEPTEENTVLNLC